MAQHREESIAIVGVGCLFPASVDAASLWRNIVEARDLFSDVPREYWLAEDFYDSDPRAVDKVYCKRGAFLPKVAFDPLKFGIPPKLLPSTDTCQLLALMVADQVVTDVAAGSFAGVRKDRIGVVLGVCSGLELLGEMSGRLQRPLWLKVLREHGLAEREVIAICDKMTSFHNDWTESTFPGLLSNVVAGRIASHFDFGGTNYTSDAACASSFAALSIAINELLLGRADLMITGGADTTNDPFTYMCFSKTPALSPTSTSRPFAESSDGMMIGEGIGMFALRRLADAERDGDQIYAVIRGVGSSSDGRSKSIYAPRWEGQRLALDRAYAIAGYAPDSVELVEAHGTGTLAGDLAEFAALRAVFEAAGRDRAGWCALGSIKSQVGHTKAAAGAIGLLKAAMALHHRVLPPTLNIDRPAERLSIDGSAFYLNSATRPWIRGADHPRRASVSSFGFGGTNFHVTLEEYAGRRTGRLRALPCELVVLGAGDRAELAARCRTMRGEVGPAGSLVHIARDSQRAGVAACRARLAVVAADEHELVAKLDQAAGALEHGAADTLATPTGIYFSERPRTGELALLFPGQGSQYLEMGAGLAMCFDACRGIWDAESTAPVSGKVPLHAVVFPPAVFTDDARRALEARLTATEWAQPAIGAVSLSMLALLRAIGVRPVCVAGHSYGELTALHAAGVYDGASLLQLSRHRGELMGAMAEGGDRGAMIAVTAPLAQVEAWCADEGLDVVIANHNAPDQVVLSGATVAIEAAEAKLTAAGLHHVRLNVGAAFHSPLVEPAGVALREVLDRIELCPPEIDVFANSSAAPYPRDADAIRDTLAMGLARRVRFAEQVDAMYARGVRTFVEVGPGAALTNLVRKICHERPHDAISLDIRGRDGISGLWRCVGRLVVAGYALDTAPLWDEYRLALDPRLAPKPAMKIEIGGVNVGRRYPPPVDAPATSTARSAPAAEPAAALSHHDAPAPSSGTPAPARVPVRVPNPPPSGIATRGTMTDDRPTSPNGNGSYPPRLPSNGQPSVDRSFERAELAPVDHQAAPWLPAPPQAPLGWLDACVEIQARTAETHLAVMRSMADLHVAFLRAAEAALSTGSEHNGASRHARTGEHRAADAAVPSEPSWLATAPAQAWSMPSQVWTPQPRPHDPERVLARQVTPRAAHDAASQGAYDARPATTAVTPPNLHPNTAAPPAMPELPRGVDPPIPSGSPVAGPVVTRAAPVASPAMLEALERGDLRGMLFQAVSMVTGYPPEILSIDQQLESDLGIDSISRVEILASFSELIPDLSKLDLSEVAHIKTLGDVLGFLERNADRIRKPGAGAP